eukprot:519090-Prorocentrum_lima.AAC.1
MTSSLVGSEMCIRDRLMSPRVHSKVDARVISRGGFAGGARASPCTTSVSYTHLTLPTICSV